MENEDLEPRHEEYLSSLSNQGSPDNPDWSFRVTPVGDRLSEQFRHMYPSAIPGSRNTNMRSFDYETLSAYGSGFSTQRRAEIARDALVNRVVSGRSPRTGSRRPLTAEFSYSRTKPLYSHGLFLANGIPADVERTYREE